MSTRIDGSSKVSTPKTVTGPDPDADVLSLDDATQEKREQLGAGRSPTSDEISSLVTELAAAKAALKTDDVGASDAYRRAAQDLAASLSSASFDLQQIAADAPELEREINSVAGDLERISDSLGQGNTVEFAAVQALETAVRTAKLGDRAEGATGTSLKEIGKEIALAALNPLDRASEPLAAYLETLKAGDSFELKVTGEGTVEEIRGAGERKISIARAQDGRLSVTELQSGEIGGGGGSKIGASVGVAVSGTELLPDEAAAAERVLDIVARNALELAIPGVGAVAGYVYELTRDGEYAEVGVAGTAKVVGGITGGAGFGVASLGTKFKPGEFESAKFVLSGLVGATLNLELADGNRALKTPALSATGMATIVGKVEGGVEGAIGFTFQGGPVEVAVNIAFDGKDFTQAQLDALAAQGGTVQELVESLKKAKLTPVVTTQVRQVLQASYGVDLEVGKVGLSIKEKRVAAVEFDQISRVVSDLLKDAA